MKKKDSYQEGECYTRDKKPKIVVEKYPFRDKGIAFDKIERNEIHSFQHIIVGWKIISNWKDGTIGEWEIFDCPLLSHEINAKFISKMFRGQSFILEVYLMETPD